MILVTVCLPLIAFAAQANYDGTFIDCPYGEFQVAQVQFTGKYLSLSAAAMPGTVSGATSVTVTIKKKDWLGGFSQVVATRTIPLDSVGYAIAVGSSIPTNQPVQILVKVNGTNQNATANVSISAYSFN